MATTEQDGALSQRGGGARRRGGAVKKKRHKHDAEMLAERWLERQQVVGSFVFKILQAKIFAQIVEMMRPCIPEPRRFRLEIIKIQLPYGGGRRKEE